MIRRFLLLALALTATGCAGLRAPSATPTDAWPVRREALQALMTWELRGRIGVQLPEQGGQATLRWRHAPAQQEIDLSGPFGAGHVRLRQDPTGVRLQDARGRVVEDADAEALLQRVTGWQMPVSGLAFWVRGVPAPDSASQEQFDEAGRLQRLQQLGWDIQFLGYHDVAGYALPSRLYLTRPLTVAAPSESGGRIEIRLAISSWELGP